MSDEHERFADALAAAVLAEGNGPKPWYLSRGVVGGVLAILSAAAAASGLAIPGWLTVDLLLAVIAAISGGGGALAIVGRVFAHRPIKGAPAPRDPRGHFNPD